MVKPIGVASIGRTGWEADERNRTADPFITSEVLYQLSYVGALAILGGAGWRLEP
jgi:hypothetical protein